MTDHRPLPTPPDPGMVQVMRVYCSQWASCGWKGSRVAIGHTHAALKAQAERKPCPRCGKEVVS